MPLNIQVKQAGKFRKLQKKLFNLIDSRLYSKLPVEIQNYDVKSFKHQLDRTNCLNKFLKCKI